MAPQTGTALLILAVFVLPGFVTLLVRERTYAVRGESDSFERLLNALYYSVLIYAVALTGGLILGLDKHDLVSLYHGKKSFGDDVGAAAIVGLALPILIAETGRRWQRSKKLRPGWLGVMKIAPGHTVSSAWNQAFGREGTLMVRATLNDGRVVGGYYGPGSLSGYSEHSQDLFIAERWQLDQDAWFEARAPSTEGVWISHENITSVEFYALPDPDSIATTR